MKILEKNITPKCIYYHWTTKNWVYHDFALSNMCYLLPAIDIYVRKTVTPFGNQIKLCTYQNDHNVFICWISDQSNILRRAVNLCLQACHAVSCIIFACVFLLLNTINITFIQMQQFQNTN